MVESFVAPAHTETESSRDDRKDQPIHFEESSNLPSKEIYKDDAAQFLEGQDLDYTPAQERALVKRMDMILLPLMGLGTGLQLVDKSALGSAATLTIQKDLHLVGSQYSWAVTIYYFGLLVGTYPSNLLLQRFHTGRVISLAFLGWGTVMLGTTGVKSFASLAVLRFLLGIFESAMAPGFTVTTARFYSQAEQPLRFALWILANFIFPCVFLLIFFGIGQVSDHPLQPWRWIFVLLGLITIIAGALMWIFLPDKPSDWKWLSERQRVICVQRVAKSQTGIKNHTFRAYQAREALTDVKVYLLCLLIICQTAGVSLQTNFLGLVIKGFGFTGLKALLLQIPGWAVGGIASVLIGYFCTHDKRLQRAKTLFLAGIAVVTVTAGAVLYTHPPTKTGGNKAIAMVMLTLLAFNLVGYTFILSMAGQNIAGTTKKQTALTMIFISYCASNIAVPQSFLARQAPQYSDGILTVLVLQAIYLVTNIALWAVARKENARRDAALREQGINLDDAGLEDILGGLNDETDKKNLRFRYQF